MAYNNLINELMAGMISPSEASSGICGLIAGEVEYMHKNESDFMMYASPILKHFEGSCKCAVKNIINLCKFIDEGKMKNVRIKSCELVIVTLLFVKLKVSYKTKREFSR